MDQVILTLTVVVSLLLPGAPDVPLDRDFGPAGCVLGAACAPANVATCRGNC